MMKWLIVLVAVTGLAGSAQGTEKAPLRPATRSVGAVERLVVISVDGLRPDLLVRAYVPNIRGLMRSGSYTMWARTTAVSVTLPSHVSMMTGVIPKRHEIDWNRDLPLARPVYPKGSTLLDLAKRHGYTTAMVAGKSKFELFERPGSLDWCWVAPKDEGAAATGPTSKPGAREVSPEEEWPEGSKKGKAGGVVDGVVAEKAAFFLRNYRPGVTFVHLPNVDNVGHGRGWGTPEQIVAVEGADAAVGTLLRALRETGAIDSTLIILSADHGGAGRTHGPDDPRSRHIPWIASGPGVRRDYDLTRHPNLVVNTEDTFATGCYFLGLRHSPRIDGKAVREIVEVEELLGVAR
jgi:predicted AlkP superfamily pyrophosphatase or phosphodiesterase